MPAVYKIEMRHGEFTWLVKRKEKHFIDLHKELRTYKTFMKIPLPSRRYATASRLLSGPKPTRASDFSHTVKRQVRDEDKQMPVLPRGGDDDLNREGQVSSRRVAAPSAAAALISAQPLMLSLIYPETAGGLPK